MGKSLEVLIIGGGPAGITAALRLAQAGVRVLLLEGAEFVGAENWSGGVYHAETLVREEVLGQAAFALAPKERRIGARHLLIHDGVGCAGFAASAVPGNDFGEAWTVLRPRFDRYVAACAIARGVTILPRTAVTGLLFEGDRVVGVETARGTIKAPVVFLAEGDGAQLLGRAGLERPEVHYAQGIKAVFALPAPLIEERFQLAPGEGLAQEWLLRNGFFRGRNVPLNAAGFLYTNQESLSVGLVLPLDRIAAHSPVDHPQLFQHFINLPEVAALLAGTTQIAYGAKVIRSGGLNEGVACAYDGLAIGGASLGLGLEFPYPHFMGPAATTGLAFAQAVLALRDQGDYSAAALEEAYGGRLRQTVDYRNARVAADWPQALHKSPLVFDHLPAFMSAQTGDLKPRARAFARMAASLLRDWATLRAVTSLPRTRALPEAPPLAVQWLVGRGGVLQKASWPGVPAQTLARALGYFYGRGIPLLETRLAAMQSLLAELPLVPMIMRAGLTVVRGGLAFAADACQVAAGGRVTLKRRSFYQTEQLAAAALSWDQLGPYSPMAWLAPLGRPQPDRRHLTVPVHLSYHDAKRLQRVCPAEVYTKGGKAYGARSVFENCIKCESCRLTVPAIDWNRVSSHRLIYELPGSQRFGLDGSAESALVIESRPEVEDTLCQRLHQALRTRPATTTRLWRKTLREALLQVAHDSERLVRWCDDGAFGAIEAAMAARLPIPHLPVDAPLAPVFLRETVLRLFPLSRLTTLAQGWTSADREDLVWLLHRYKRLAEPLLAALAAHDPALAFVAAHHLLAEGHVGAPLATLTALVSQERDGLSAWLPDTGGEYRDCCGPVILVIVARGAGLDAARPVRVKADGAAPFAIGASFARYYCALMEGFAGTLRTRAGIYARTRVQFASSYQDYEGRDTIIKFGAVKRLLAIIEYGLSLTQRLAPLCAREPVLVVALLKARFGVSLDSVAWAAGQVFGGAAYSEDDILGPRYRDAMMLAQWPGAIPVAPLAWETSLWHDDLLYAPQAIFLRHGFALGPVLSRLQPLKRRLKLPAVTLTPVISYRSGHFLFGAILTPATVLVPEYFLSHPPLRRMRAQVLRLLRSGFKDPAGGPYGRFIDARHGIPKDDIDRLRAFKAFATVVPERLGGKGLSKAEYAVLTSLLMGRADTSVGLLVMASTSIGTMPVLLALEKDLPRLEQELKGFAPSAVHRLQRLSRLLQAWTQRPWSMAIALTLKAIDRSLRGLLLRPGSALKYLARDVLRGFESVVRVARTQDLERLAVQTHAFQESLSGLLVAVHEERAGLDSRIKAHERFVQFLAHGQISAFALTEPTAGSDTGGISARARRLRAPLWQEAGGLWGFAASGGVRVLLDERRLDLQGPVVFYRLPNGEAAHLDDSGWDLARQAGRRAIVCDSGVRYEYDDVGCPVVTETGLVYDYYELSGAKMWITNGSIADRYCLYAQTELGETGFMVERRSEGLGIGHNERKLGQRASPTNELTLNAVRVCRSHVIGYQGHGQVSALETLSVGRGGLVVGCGSLLERLLCDYAPLWAQYPKAHAVALYEYERVRTLGARLIGLMDHADLRHGDFRIEAALSKFMASEGLHRVLLALEEIRGPMAASTTELIEKWRRDARILNIYEGTNEIQRFLVLKDLPSLFAHRPRLRTTTSPKLDQALAAFAGFMTPRAAELKATISADGDGEIAWFPVVDWLAELYVWIALVERRQSLATQAVGPDYLEKLSLIETAVADQAQAHADHVQRLFADRSSYEDAVRALAERTGEPLLASVKSFDPAFTGRVVVLLRSITATGPHDIRFHPGDQAVLDQALAAQDAEPRLQVTVVVVTQTPYPDGVVRLRAAKACVIALVMPGLADPVAISSALGDLEWDLLLAGPAEQSFLAALSGALQASYLPSVVHVGARLKRGYSLAQEGRVWFIATARRTVASCVFAATGRSDEFSVGDWLSALKKAPEETRLTGHAWRHARLAKPQAPADEAPWQCENPQALARWLVGQGRGPQASPGTWQAGTVAALQGTVAVVASGGPGAAPALIAKGLDPQAHTLWLAATQGDELPQGVVGDMWRLVGAAPLGLSARRLAQSLQASSFIVLGAAEAPLAAVLAQLLNRPLYLDVTAAFASAGDLFIESAGLLWRVPHSLSAILVSSVQVTGGDLRPALLHIVADEPPLVGSRGGLARRLGRPIQAGLAAAQVIVDVGLGAADAAFVKRALVPLTTQLTALFGCEVRWGATRKVVQESKILPFDHQIGQTGVSVAPRILLALGVSGAPQHLTGIAHTTQIIAINRDPDAPIFRARDGAKPVIRCVGDVQAWVEELIAVLPK